MRALPLVAWICALCSAAVLGCNQDYAASNAEREPFMDARAAAPPVAASASAAPSAAAMAKPAH
jgi:hypothetical protein